MKAKTYYDEVKRYVDNAKDSLTKTTIVDGFYEDEKYVKQAGGIAYAGLEKAARWYLELNGYKQSIDDYYAIERGLAKFNHKAQKIFHHGYQILHKDAYYGDTVDVDTIKSGLKRVVEFAEFLKPFNGSILPEHSSNYKKHRFSGKKK